MHGRALASGMASPWKMLYAMTWLVVLEFVLGAIRSPPLVVGLLHLALGLGLVALALANFRALAASRAPGRIKRTARSTITLSSTAAVLGILLFFNLGRGVGMMGITIWGIILAVHVFFAVAVLAEAAAIGMSYDMWEEREFAAETAPGEVPAMPAPGSSM